MTRLIFLFTSIALLYSCALKEHLVFSNILIDGHLNMFAGKLTKSGFTLSDSTKKGEIILKGDFLNKQCTIIVFGTEKNIVTYKVVVNLPVEVHDSLQSDFGKIQNQYSSKYGTGYSKFQQYKERERLVYKVPAREVMVGDYTKYITDSGEITVEVQENYISITYLDKLNYELWKREFDQKQEPNGGKTE